jgi:hypothetical protein
VSKYEQWVGAQQRVRAFATDGATHAEGVVVSYATEPTVCIRTDGGRMVSWLARLCESVQPLCKAEESVTGISCGLRQGHAPAPHEGTSQDDGDRVRVGYPLTVRWPSQGGAR